MLLCFYKDLLTHWGAAVSANPQWVFYLVFTEVLPSTVAVQIITSQIIPIRNANKCEQCRPLTTHDSQVKVA
jgi:hypothetical protein